jgi:AraC-like DNA-binding protein
MFLELKKNLRQSLSSALPEIGMAIQDKQMQYHSPAIPSNYKIAEVVRKLRYEDTDYDFTPFPRLTPALQLLNEFTEGYRRAILSDPSLSFPYKDALIGIRNEILYAPNIRRQTAVNLSVKYAISASTLWKEFHNVFGTTLTAFVQKTAMAKSRLLLTTTTIPIHVIAGDIGYSQVGNFSRAFRQYFKMLPQQMRFRTGIR